MIKGTTVRQKFLGISFASLLFFVLIALDVIFDGALTVFDQLVHSWSLGWHAPLLDKVIFGITHLGNLSTMLFYSVIIIVLFSWKKEWKSTRFYLIGMLGSTALFSGIKELVGRSRPSSYIGEFHQHGYSFPSGHSTMSMTFALLIFFLFYPKVSGGYRVVLIAFCLLFPLLIGFSRIYLGVHYFSDVMGGFTLAVFWVMLMAGVSPAPSPKG